MKDVKEIFKLIQKSLLTKTIIDEKSSTNNVEEWDSLGQLSIITALDKKFKGKLSDDRDIADCYSVKSILKVLKKNKLIDF